MLPAPTWALTCSSVSSDTPFAHWDEQLGCRTKDETELMFYCPIYQLETLSSTSFCFVPPFRGAQITFRITKDIINACLNMVFITFSLINLIYDDINQFIFFNCCSDGSTALYKNFFYIVPMSIARKSYNP